MRKGHRGRGSVGRAIKAGIKRGEYAKDGLCTSCDRERDDKNRSHCSKCREYTKKWKLKNEK